MKIYIYAACLAAYVLCVGAAPLVLSALGIDIHFHPHYFWIPAASTALALLILFAPACILILLIRREIRRKRQAETSR